MDDPTNTQRGPAVVDKTPTEVRQGETHGVVRWVLGLSLGSVIVAFVLVVVFMHGI